MLMFLIFDTVKEWGTTKALLIRIILHVGAHQRIFSHSVADRRSDAQWEYEPKSGIMFVKV